MMRLVLVLGLAVCAAGLALPAPAQAQRSQPGARAYAPEDLRQLSVADRTRVLRLEYSEQSNGRRLPDDQLRFYLDQINSGWTFSRIKADMARSLDQGGRPPGGGWGPPGQGPVGETVTCESIKDRYRNCGAPFQGRARLVEQLSHTRCIENQNWGSRPGSVWVDGGCRGVFAEGSTWGPPGGYTVTCSSIDRRYATCAWNGRYGTPVLVQRLSKAQCREGEDWGYRRGTLWVDNGCRGRFGSR